MTWTTPESYAVDERLTSAKLNTNVRDNLTALAPDGVTSASWAPILTGSSSGSSAAADTGREYRIGPIQFAWAYWSEPSNTGDGTAEFGGVGAIQLALPASTALLTAAAAGGQVIGEWRYHDHSTTTASQSGAVYLSAAGTVRFGLPDGNVLTGASYSVSTDDSFSVSLCYAVA